jgi:hypothetical protein
LFTQMPPALQGVVGEHGSPAMARGGQVPFTIPAPTLHAPSAPPPLQIAYSLTLKKPHGMPGSAAPTLAQVRFASRVHHKPSIKLQA